MRWNGRSAVYSSHSVIPNAYTSAACVCTNSKRASLNTCTWGGTENVWETLRRLQGHGAQVWA